jgi:hypothetical protein
MKRNEKLGCLTVRSSFWWPEAKKSLNNQSQCQMHAWVAFSDHYWKLKDVVARIFQWHTFLVLAFFLYADSTCKGLI